MNVTIATLLVALWVTGTAAASGAPTERAGSAQTDTVIAVKQGTRLEVENFSGAIAVRTWPKSAIRVEATHSRRMQIEIEGDESSVAVHGRAYRGPATHVDYVFTVPDWMALNLSGVATDISVEGLKNQIKAETIKGDIDVRGGTGYLALGSVEGVVQVRGARGKVEVSSVNRGVRLADVTGDVSAESVNGSILLQSVDADRVEASTINGTLFFLGTIRNDGTYTFSTHNGDIWVAVPEKANATVAVATFGGDFRSTFPVTLKETKAGKRFNFVLGNGGARLELESFQGRIRLARPGELMAALPAHAKAKVKDKNKEAGDESGEFDFDFDWNPDQEK
jgi:hypothetical protein